MDILLFQLTEVDVRILKFVLVLCVTKREKTRSCTDGFKTHNKLFNSSLKENCSQSSITLAWKIKIVSLCSSCTETFLKSDNFSSF